MGTEMNAEDAVLIGRTQGHRLAAEGLADMQLASSQLDVAARINFANDVARPVFNQRKCFGKRPLARAVAVGRRGKSQRFMRAFVIVDMTPTVKGALTINEIRKAVAAQHLGLERT